jgi:23S rRNA (pseudouridine1915-N3)-methyltransferase
VKTRIIAVGKVREKYVEAALEDYRKRLRRLGPFEELEVAASHGGDPERAMRHEGERILRALVPSEPCWLLDRQGTPLSSIELATKVTMLADAGATRLNLVIAGTYGASEQLRRRADFTWSLSSLTFLHEWARALVVEQLYRAAKIARNEPYHH